jgi:hypothetical protein
MMTILRTSFVASTALLALLVSSTQAQFFQMPSLTDGFDNLIPEWLPQCFNGVNTFNPIAVVECVQDQVLPSCLQDASAMQDTFGGVAECISGSVGDEVTQFFEGLTGDNPLAQALASRKGGEDNKNDLGDLVDGFLSSIGIGEEAEGLFNIGSLFVNSTRTCLDPLVGCVNETIQQAVDTLNPCLNFSLFELVQCGQQNGDACLESCNATEVQAQFESNPFELAFTEVATCPLIQANIVDPFCTLVGCCEPCVPQVEALMNCVINQQLDQVPIVQGDCALTCPTERRRLGAAKKTTSSSSTSSRRVQTIASPNAPDECLQYAPGLTGDDSEELSARSSIFLPCAYNSFAKAMEETPQVVSNTAVDEEETESETNNEQAGTPSDGSSATTTSAAAVSLWKFQWVAAASVAVSLFALSN